MTLELGNLVHPQRNRVKRILEKFGYTVLTAQHGKEALRMAERHKGPIDLMIIGVVMPQMSGHKLVERIAPLHPEMSVLYMSGYDEKTVADQGLMDPERQFLQKPFLPKDVASKIREILDMEMSPPTKDDRNVLVLDGYKGASIQPHRIRFGETQRPFMAESGPSFSWLSSILNDRFREKQTFRLWFSENRCETSAFRGGADPFVL